MTKEQQARFEAKPLKRWEPMEGSMLEQSPTGWFVRYEDYVAPRSKVSSQSELIAALAGALKDAETRLSGQLNEHTMSGHKGAILTKIAAALALARDLGVE